MKESIQYRLARAIIRHLRADKELTYQAPGAEEPEHIVYGEPFDSADQAAALAVASAQYGVAVMVAPQGVRAPESTQTGYASMLELTAVVYVLSTRQVPSACTVELPGGGLQELRSAGELAATYADRVAARLLTWMPEVLELAPLERPSISDILTLDMQASKDFPGHENLVGSAIIISQKVNYREYYGLRKR